MFHFNLQWNSKGKAISNEGKQWLGRVKKKWLSGFYLRFDYGTWFFRGWRIRFPWTNTEIFIVERECQDCRRLPECRPTRWGSAPRRPRPSAWSARAGNATTWWRRFCCLLQSEWTKRWALQGGAVVDKVKRPKTSAIIDSSAPINGPLIDFNLLEKVGPDPLSFEFQGKVTSVSTFGCHTDRRRSSWRGCRSVRGWLRGSRRPCDRRRGCCGPGSCGTGTTRPARVRWTARAGTKRSRTLCRSISIVFFPFSIAVSLFAIKSWVVFFGWGRGVVANSISWSFQILYELLIRSHLGIWEVDFFFTSARIWPCEAGTRPRWNRPRAARGRRWCPAVSCPRAGRASAGSCRPCPRSRRPSGRGTARGSPGTWPFSGLSCSPSATRSETHKSIEIPIRSWSVIIFFFLKK